MITKEFTEVWNKLVELGLKPETIWRDNTIGIWVYVHDDELAAIAALADFPQMLISYNREVNETYHIVKGVWVELAH